MSTKSDLLLLSNSTMKGHGYLEHAFDTIGDFLGSRRTVHFAPYALADYDEFTELMSTVFRRFGARVIGLHTLSEPQAALNEADVLVVGGGNSFRLLKALHDNRLLGVVRRRVASGDLSYVGTSAGTSVACPSIRTTNDMPIVDPDTLESFALVPFQINPHYLDPDPDSTHMENTRDQRLRQFHEENEVDVLGIREGSWLRRRGRSLTLHGSTGARLFRWSREEIELNDGSDLSFLLAWRPRYVPHATSREETGGGALTLEYAVRW
jgi:dipeptidase E